ncbi:chaperonin 10-like protein [Lophiotrema nucula]|uniref:Chaperonin 10-like protein n=1 Tax=Lophiotrema nucula TaxID=690887 RepID=A0A6A5Z4N0_9PLEO|nr:chaperonin 10-like protein [Lophiotrema nucula]
MTTQSLPKGQKALVQTTYAAPLELKTTPVPEVVPGSAIVKILACPVISYAKEVYNGTRKYPYPTPIIPGYSAIGRIAALGPDATSLKIGQLVHIDSTVRSRDDPNDVFLMGLVEGHTEGAKKLMADVWRNGTWAQYCRAPLENCLSLNEQRLVHELGYDISDLATLGKFLVAYGGLRDIELQAGETIVVAPATGGFGGAAVLTAVAMGARVIAMGRNERKLSSLVDRFSDGRVKTVRISNDIETDTVALKAAAAGATIDAVFDISPNAAAKSTHLKSLINVIKVGGQISMMGGVYADVPIPYAQCMHKDIKLKGKWMYSREQALSLIKMVEAGVLKVGGPGGVSIKAEYGFEDWEKAFDDAEKYMGWDATVIMKPAEN